MIEEIVQGQRSCDFEHKYVISVTSANTQISHWFCSVPTATIRSLISSFLTLFVILFKILIPPGIRNYPPVADFIARILL